MRAQVKSKANALIAAIMAAIFAFSLSGVPASALAVPEGDKTLSVQGVDFLQPQAEGWELLKVDNLGDQAIYITVKKDDKPLSNPIKYTADMNNGVSNSGTGEQIAQLIALQIFDNVDMQDAKEAKNANEIFGNPNDHAQYTVEVNSALMQGTKLFSGKICPVYAKIVDNDGSSELALLGVRTASTKELQDLERKKTEPKKLGVGGTYYKQADGEEYATTYKLDENGNTDCTFDSDLQAFVVTYTEVGQGTVEGQIRYVDTDGNLIKTVPVSGIGKDGKEVGIMESFTTAEGEADNATITYWRTISALGGKTVKLTSNNASYTVMVVEVKNMDKSSYTVTIKYVDENDKLLWSDTVDVKGYGYRYTLPNLFSIDQKYRPDQTEGINLYQLASVTGGKVVTDSQAAGTEEIIVQNDEASEEEANTPQGPSSTTIVAEDTNGTALIFTKDMTNFVDDNGERTVIAKYNSQNATAEVKFTLVEMDGETGQELGRVTSTIKPGEKFSYNPITAAESEERLKGYVPWAGNTEEIAYTWESLGQSVDLLQYVYYVPEDYVPGDAYDVTVQYVNVVNGSVIQTQTVNVDPEITNWVEITGPQTLMQGGEEYVRLAGQDTTIRHAFLSPNRTYTIYYRNVNDTINANTIIDRVQIIQTTQPGTGGGLTAAPVAVDDAGDGPAVDAGVGAGDGTVIINDDDNPLANLDGQDTTTERTIAENENPLASGAAQSWPVIAGVAVGVIVLIGLVAYFLLRRRKQANDKQNA